MLDEADLTDANRDYSACGAIKGARSQPALAHHRPHNDRWTARERRTRILVYAEGYFAIFETLSFVQLVWELSAPVQEQWRGLAHRASQLSRETGVIFPAREIVWDKTEGVSRTSTVVARNV